ncbi:sodium- and chloride-dependent GABA transporter 3-like [Nelusetta ayraudi]|uniref:sodium- and chloride-dependent GABA transporter 3-like n=1 Tax=Nelusetta ayraudi TaxID=303726 RepID=UPI003F718F52
MFLLETSIGQYTQQGTVTCWRKLCPLASGIGYGHLVMKMYDFGYTVIEAWSLLYLGFSFSSQLPWATCNNTWNTENCLAISQGNSRNATTNESMLRNTTSAAIEFWQRRVLGLSAGIEEPGQVRWDLAVCLLICWTLCYFSIWKSVRSSGKVAYFTATFPYVTLLILLIRGVTLPGAGQGIYYYLYPNISRLANIEVWIDAMSQISFSYSISAGSLIVLGSFSDYNNNCYKDCFWLCLLNSATSFVAGFVVFSVLGFMAHQHGTTVDSVADSGPGLAFITYPQATAMIPLPQLWAFCFFLMLILLAIDSHFVMVESFITTVSDLFPKVFHAPQRHELFALATCLFGFFINLSLITEGGIYVFQLIEAYGSTRMSQNFLAICECLAIGWIYGADNVLAFIKDMTGSRPHVFFKLCWKYIIPLLSLVSLILYFVDYKHLKFNNWYVYPDWAYALGWTMVLTSFAVLILTTAGQMCQTSGTFMQRLSFLCQPAEEPDWRRQAAEDVTEMTPCDVMA